MLLKKLETTLNKFGDNRELNNNIISALKQLSEYVKENLNEIVAEDFQPDIKDIDILNYNYRILCETVVAYEKKKGCSKELLDNLTKVSGADKFFDEIRNDTNAVIKAFKDTQPVRDMPEYDRIKLFNAVIESKILHYDGLLEQRYHIEYGENFSIVTAIFNKVVIFVIEKRFTKDYFIYQIKEYFEFDDNTIDFLWDFCNKNKSDLTNKVIFELLNKERD